MRKFTSLLIFLFAFCINAQDLTSDFIEIEKKVIEWRRYFHQNPELSNREFNTAKKIAKHLKSLGLVLGMPTWMLNN